MRKSSIDTELNGQILSLKTSQGWLRRGAKAFVDKMLMLGMMDFKPSDDMLKIQELL